jgi:hypothetical protein
LFFVRESIWPSAAQFPKNGTGDYRRSAVSAPERYVVQRYRTEIVIAPDRVITLHLPPHFPEGRAIVVVQAEEPTPGAPHVPEEDRQDIEWWEEFEESDTFTPDDDRSSIP